jgi:deoxyribodipyrimidine photo-lyase
MLVSVAAYPLWLHWQPVGQWLARQFLDYEPGIHWSQMQMQSGTTGINTTRVYNPIKQAQDHDPHGHFVRRWLPYMRRVPDAWLFEPWRMPQTMQAHLKLTIGINVRKGAEFDIPHPVVDLQTATREAKAKLHSRRAQPEVKAGKAAIVEKHASRALKPASKTVSRRKATSKPENQQITLDF